MVFIVITEGGFGLLCGGENILSLFCIAQKSNQKSLENRMLLAHSPGHARSIFGPTHAVLFVFTADYLVGSRRGF